jgi:uncharacterized membrane protein YedE/YeeE
VKFKIKTNLWTGIIFTVFAAFMFLMMETQVRLPGYDSGAPSPRVLPTIFLAIILVCSVVLIIQSLVFKKEKVVEYDVEKEKPMITLIVLLCVYPVLIGFVGYVVASIICFPLALLYIGERKKSPYIVAVVAAVLIYMMFKNIFNISLPACPFIPFL